MTRRDGGQNALSLRAATECENATRPKCVCRCGGKLHGARRTADVGTLSAVDPHFPAADANERVRETRRLVYRMASWYRRQRPEWRTTALLRDILT